MLAWPALDARPDASHGPGIVSATSTSGGGASQTQSSTGSSARARMRVVALPTKLCGLTHELPTHENQLLKNMPVLHRHSEEDTGIRSR